MQTPRKDNSNVSKHSKRSLSSAEGNRKGDQGQFAEEDSETGWSRLSRDELRMYDSRIGRWMTTDPVGQHFSPYLSMSNSPTTNIDPDGRYDSKKMARKVRRYLRKTEGFKGGKIFKSGDEYYVDFGEQSPSGWEDGKKLFHVGFEKEAITPDVMDGHLDLWEANAWYKFGGGDPVTVDVKNYDWDIYDSHFKKGFWGNKDVQQLSVHYTFGLMRKDDGKEFPVPTLAKPLSPLGSVFGGVTLKNQGDGTFSVTSDEYDF